MAEGEQRSIKLRQVRAAEIHQSGIVISLDPDRAAVRLQRRNPEPFGLRQGARGVAVVKAAVEADHAARLGLTQIRFEPGECFAPLIGWAGAARRTAPGAALCRDVGTTRTGEVSEENRILYSQASSTTRHR